MKAALFAALFGALLAVSFACPDKVYHSCVKEEKPPKCTAIEVCEYPQKEPCGQDHCEYPFVCASLKKKECYNFLALKEKCGVPKKVCKEIKKPCGNGVCGAHQDCVKETVCKVEKHGHRHLRKLMDDRHGASFASASSKAVAIGDATARADADAFAKDGGIAISKADAIAVGGGHYDGDKYFPQYFDNCDKDCDKDKLVCEEEFKCVAKDPCVDVTVKKCVKKEYKEGIDVCHGGHLFHWLGLNDGEICGDEYCGYGYKCAEVIIQKCKKQCGDYQCDHGYECATEYEDPECDKFVYLESICKDVYEPVCVKLPPYVIAKYKPPCKTVFKCEVDDRVCGNKYCPYGFVCAVDYKKSCDASYRPHYKGKVVEKPHKKDDPKKDDPKYEYPVGVRRGDDSDAKAAIKLSADDNHTSAKGLGTSTGGGSSAYQGVAANKDGSKSGVSGRGSKDGVYSTSGTLQRRDGMSDAYANTAHSN